MTDDTISRAAALTAICEDGTQLERQGQYSMTMAERKQRDIDILSALPSAQPSVSKEEMVGDAVSRHGVLRLLNAVPSEEFATKAMLIGGVNALPSAQPGCEDAVPRTSVEYICRKNTVSTNPYEHKYHDKFIQFMDDPEISDFGRWQHSNGFNTALVAVKCDLDKVPSVTPKQPGWIPCTPETMPPDYQWYYATCKSLVDNRENWVVEGCYTPWEHFDSTPMIKCGDAEVIAWMPKGFPEPWEGDTDAH